MHFITLEEGRQYLRVDSHDEDTVIEALLRSAEALCREVGRLSEEQWEDVCGEGEEEESSEVGRNRSLLRISILYTLGYLYEHREEADHHRLSLTLRALLSGIREGVV